MALKRYKRPSLNRGKKSNPARKKRIFKRKFFQLLRQNQAHGEALQALFHSKSPPVGEITIPSGSIYQKWQVAPPGTSSSRIKQTRFTQGILFAQATLLPPFQLPLSEVKETFMHMNHILPNGSAVIDGKTTGLAACALPCDKRAQCLRADPALLVLKVTISYCAFIPIRTSEEP